MYGGIDQLVNTYKGNPQPLQAKVQQAQQGQPPGEVPPDLEEAIALQKIAELRSGVQNQQAMQAGGAQPSVVQKLKQMLGNIQQQGQPQMAQAPQMPQGGPPQGQPVMAAHGGSIAHLVSNLGQHYAGGGIIAFSKPTDENNQSLVNDPNTESSQFAQDIAQLPQAFDDWKQRAREEDARRAEQDRRMEQYKQDKLAAQQKTSLFNYLFGSPEREKEGQAKLTELSNAPVSSAATPAVAPDAETEKLKALAAARAQTGVNTNPDLVPRKRITGTLPDDAARNKNTSGAGNNGGAAQQTLDPNSLRALVEGHARKEMGLNPETERQNAVDFSRKTMGIDDLMKERESRINAREKAINEAKANRTPAWVEALSAAGRPVRGGIGTLLNQMGNAAESTRKGYSNEDLAYQAELDRLRDVITDAKLKGNMELAKEGMAAYKEVDARKRSAATNATSLLENDERIAQRKADTAARLAASAGNAPLKATNAAEAAYERDPEVRVIMKQLESTMYTMGGADPTPLINKLHQIRATKYAQNKIKMEEDTGASQASSGSSLKYNPKTGKIE